jgi:hypothetical protein
MKSNCCNRKRGRENKFYLYLYSLIKQHIKDKKDTQLLKKKVFKITILYIFI